MHCVLWVPVIALHLSTCTSKSFHAFAFAWAAVMFFAVAGTRVSRRTAQRLRVAASQTLLPRIRVPLAVSFTMETAANKRATPLSRCRSRNDITESAGGVSMI